MKIAFLGDTALFGKYSIENESVYKYFQEMSIYLADFDYVVANLEAPFARTLSNGANKSANISSNPKNIEILKYLNVNIVCLANNHILDFGLDGLNETIKTLESNGIDWFGVYGRDIVISKLNLALHGYCSYNTNPIGLSSTNSGVASLDYEKVIEKFCEYKKLGLVNVVCNHSGIENVTTPSVDDIVFARNLSKIDDYIYIGHHPHVMQPIETINGSYISYSLGNFCFDEIYDARTNDVLVCQSEENKVGLIKTFFIDGTSISSGERAIYQGVDSLGFSKTPINELKFDDVTTYNENRVREIVDSIKSRNSRRDFRWLIARISPYTFIRVITRRYNSYMYKKVFSSKLR
ncbi:CapA family protein [Shewanella schlegeliana]|uniref:CapA family protein n=1 Tax=Shewanella schlegeliana TaxID=190308 RepID=A0ABS1SVL4_9GAMM|nr:CapA family protein [Shewanella schlegeliana]MBL4911627.1 CapA family protein [Shewanella schlegeliana]MCL1111689.1 CapA family protein [Shewanella schlegeliana]